MRPVLRRQRGSTSHDDEPTALPPHEDGRWRPCIVGEAGRAATSVVASPDLDEPERPDTVVDGYAVRDASGRPGLEVRAASVRGLAHRYYGRVRQDSASVRTTADGRWLVVLVADGVSAGPRSHLAADAATHGGGRDLAAVLAAVPPAGVDWDAFLARTATAVATAVGEPGTDGDTAGATTLLVGIVATSADAHGHRTAHLLGVGDSSAWTLTGEGWQRAVGGKDDGVYASTATAALPHIPTPVPLPVVLDLGPNEVLALVTDGIGDPLDDGRGEVGAFLAQEWAAPPPPLAFAAQVDFARRSFDDDRTAVVLWPLP